MFVIRFDISFVPLQALQLRGRVSTGVPPSFACPKRRERIDSEQQAEKFRFAFLRLKGFKRFWWDVLFRGRGHECGEQRRERHHGTTAVHTG